MGLTEIIAAAGFSVVTGHSRLNAALNMGIEVHAVDNSGMVYRINLKELVLTIEEAPDLEPNGGMIILAKMAPPTLH